MAFNPLGPFQTHANEVKPDIKIGQRWVFCQNKELTLTIKNKSMNHPNVWGVTWNNYTDPGVMSRSSILDGFYLSDESIVDEVLAKYLK
jgi:hypothetical protein